MENPLVTILMPVYNAELFLRKAIESILSQTYKNIEFLIIHDGSTDNSLSIIKSYSDKRIVLLVNNKNQGLIYSLNIGLEKAKGKYIARMDADDISLPNRIEKQCIYMENNNSIGVLGTFIQNENKFKVYSNPQLTSNELKARLLFTNIFSHPTIMFRNSILKEKNILYDQEYKHAEDYNLWLNIIAKTDFAILNETLLHYENHQNQVSAVFNSEQKKQVIKSQLKFFTSLNLNFNDEELEIHKRLFYQDYIFNQDFLKATEIWLLKILNSKELQAIVGKAALEKTLSVIWFEVCTNFATKKRKNFFKTSLLYIPQNISKKSKLIYNLKNVFTD